MEREPCFSCDGDGCDPTYPFGNCPRCGGSGIEPAENPWQRGDDDGVEYSDPRDEWEDRLRRD